jgi:predicted nucleic acid-binding protein
MAIASCLVDTNILPRMTRRSDPQHQVVDAALARLAGQGTVLHYRHQNVAELWNAMTSPVVRNGFGLSAAEAEREVRAIEAGMSFLPDSEAVYREWRRIVLQCGVLGVQVHDARLAAAMYVHSVAHILTLNVTDFSRFSDLTAMHPGSIH